MAPHRLWPLGRLLVALSAVGYALLWIAYVLKWSWVSDFDTWALDALYEYGSRRPGWVQFWDVFCDIFGPGGFRLFGLVVIVFALTRRNVRAALFLAATLWFSGLVTLTAKYLADRPRPSGVFITLRDTSFPSGHAVAVMSSVLGLLMVSAGLLGPRMRQVAVIAGVLVVVTVGVGRVVLNAHHPSDVVAGWALGYLWFVLCLVLIRPQPLQPRSAPVVTGGAAAAGTPEARDSAS